MVDIPSYEGIWWELAKTPFIYEQNCKYSTAYYKWNTNMNNMDVINTCYYPDGKTWEIKGSANLLYGKTFLVSFPGYNYNINDQNKLYGNYHILYTDYINYSIVVNPTFNNIWILSRHTNNHIEDLNYLINILNNNAYNTNNLIINNNLISK